MQESKQINRLFPESLNKDEIKRIIIKACPKEWKRTQIKGKITTQTMQEQVNYYDDLMKLEVNHSSANNNKNQKRQNVQK